MKLFSTLRLRCLSRGLWLAVLGLSGCNLIPPAQEDMTRFYVLSSDVPVAETSPTGVSVAIRPVTVAGYLTHRDLVVRNGENEIAFKDLARWAEPIDTGVARIVRSHLLAAPGVSHVYLPPTPLDAPRDYEVTIDVIRCEGARTAAGTYVARFSGIIEIHKAGATDETGVRRVFQAEDRPWDGHDYSQLVSLLSQDVEGLGGAVADALPKK